MSNYSALKATLNANIRENNNEEITGMILNHVLDDMINSLGADYQFAGFATPATTFGTPDEKVFWLAVEPGNYSNGLSVEDGDGLVCFYWITQWAKMTLPLATFNQVLGSFVKEAHFNPDVLDPSKKYFVRNVARNLSGNWYIAIEDENGTQVAARGLSTEQDTFIDLQQDKGYILVDWSMFPDGVQRSVDIPIVNPFDADYNPRYFLGYEFNGAVKEIISDNLWKIFAWDNSSPGYFDTNNTDGTPAVQVGDTLSVTGTGTSFTHAMVEVVKGDTIYVPYWDWSGYTISFPVITDKALKVLQVVSSVGAQIVEIDGANYFHFQVEEDGYLIVSTNNPKPLYSDNPDLRRQSYPSPDPDYFDYEVALSLPKSTLVGMVESASNGACTVKFDDNGYPSLMYRIPVMPIGLLAPELGDMDTPHPAFMVNGVRKKHIYVGVFLNSEYNGVPVSWWGLDQMASKTFRQCRSLCAGKGTGWHLETIWERSLLSLLSMKYHASLTPRGNTNFGCSGAEGFEYECVESDSDFYMPGGFPSGGKWINGTQPVAWSHNNTRWGVFDLVGGFHEFCDLAKMSTNGRIYLCPDNDFTKAESAWTNTGAYLAFSPSIGVHFATAKASDTSWGSQFYRNVPCAAAYDSLPEATRKLLALSLLCPRMRSSDTEAIFPFDGDITLRTGQGTCYPFMGGAEEYPGNAGLGTIWLAYDGDTGHNNMGSRLVYIE